MKTKKYSPKFIAGMIFWDYMVRLECGNKPVSGPLVMLAGFLSQKVLSKTPPSYEQVLKVFKALEKKGLLKKAGCGWVVVDESKVCKIGRKFRTAHLTKVQKKG